MPHDNIRRKVASGYNVSLDAALKQGGFYDSTGTWNSLVKIDGKILRGRVETLVFKKDQQQVYMYIRNYNKKRYSIPGGSFEKDTPNYIQAQNEINEEARIKVKNLVNSGQHYIKEYKYPPMGVDEKLRWTGSYTEVYVAEYDGPYTGHIDEEDKYDDMYKNGKFYNLYEVYPILSDTHRIIIDSIFPTIEKGAIDESMIILGESNNNDVHYYPYYTPSEMSKLGVFNESKNKFSHIEDDAIEWYLEYTDTLLNPDSENWLNELKDRYDEYRENPTLESKQLILNLGWNPEIPVTLENVLRASNNTKDRINKKENNIITIDENMIFSKKDIVQNIDDFESRKSNIALVTGMSGSGKSTLAHTLAEQYNAQVINLDYFQSYYKISKSNSGAIDKDDISYVIIDRYMSSHQQVKKDAIKFSDIDLISFEQYFVPFFNWLIDELQKDKNNRYIIEGIHIMLYIPYKQVKGYPLYCINTSVIKSLVRHWIRDGWTIRDIVKYGYGDILRFSEWNKTYDNFKSSMNEATIYDPISGGYVKSPFTIKDFYLTADVIKQSIVKHHEKGELTFITNRDTETDDGKFVFAQYDIADKNDSASMITFINNMNGLIKASVYPGSIEIPEYIKKSGMLYLIDDEGFLDELSITNDGIISEAKRVKGQEYKIYGYDEYMQRKVDQWDFDKDSETIDNYSTIATTSIGKGGALDSIAQNYIEELDVEKEKELLNSKDIVTEYINYADLKMRDIDSSKNKKTQSTLLRMIEQEKLYLSGILGINDDKIMELILGNYFGMDQIFKDRNNKSIEDPSVLNQEHQDIIRRILKMRLNYVNKITAIMSDMIKSNYKVLGLSDKEAEVYLQQLTSQTNNSVKAVSDIKGIIQQNKSKFLINNGEALDLRSLGFGIIFTTSESLGFANSTNEDVMLKYIQAAMRYDAVVVAHGSSAREIEYKRRDVQQRLMDIFNFTREYFHDIATRIEIQYSAKPKGIRTAYLNSEYVVSAYLDNIVETELSDILNSTMDVDNMIDHILQDKKPSEREIINVCKLEPLVAACKNIAKRIQSNSHFIEYYKEECNHESVSEDVTDMDIYNGIFSATLKNCNNCMKGYLRKFENKLESALEDRANDGDLEYTWYCQPTRTLRGGPFNKVDDVVRQLIKEGFKKIMILDCNPGGHKLASDIMRTKGVLINYSSFSNLQENAIFTESHSNDENYNTILEVEQALREMAEYYDIDYDDDIYLNECYDWYTNGMEVINEGVVHILWEFFKKCVAAIIRFFKAIINFFKNLIIKVKELFCGTSSNVKDTKTSFPKIKCNIIDAKKRDIVEITGTDRQELKQKADKVNNSIAFEIKQFKNIQDKNIKRIEQDVKILEREASARK